MVSLNRDALSDKVLEGARISSEEAIQLYQLPLEELGALANVRRNLAQNFGPCRRLVGVAMGASFRCKCSCNLSSHIRDEPEKGAGWQGR